MNVKTTNKQVAVEVFKTNQTEKDTSRGLTMPDRLTTKLLATKVVLNSDNYFVGDTLYFRSEIVKLPYALNKLQLGELVFVMVPESDVVAYEKAYKELHSRGD